MTLSECLADIQENLVIVDAVEDYIAKPQNIKDFCGNLIPVFDDNKQGIIFDYLEMVDYNKPEILSSEEKDGNAMVEFGVSYTIEFFQRQNCIAKVSAYSEGKCNFLIKEDVWYMDIRILELKNIKEKFEYLI